MSTGGWQVTSECAARGKELKRELMLSLGNSWGRGKPLWKRIAERDFAMYYGHSRQENMSLSSFPTCQRQLQRVWCHGLTYRGNFFFFF